MLLTIVAKEIHQNILTFRFAIGSAITLALVILGTLIASEDYSLRLQSYQTKVQEGESALRKVHTYSYLQPTVARRPEPLSIFDQGYDAQSGTDVSLNIYQVPMQAEGKHRGNEFMSGFRGVDLTLLVKVVLGLLALLMTFDAVVGEKEDGVLKLTLSNAVSRPTLLLGKYLGSLIALFLPLIISLMIGLLILLLSAKVQLTMYEGVRIAGILAAYLAYLSVMLLLGTLVSMLTHRAATSLVLCVFIWLVAVFILPNSATALSNDVFGTNTDERVISEQIAQLEKERDQSVRKRRDPFLDRAIGYAPGINLADENGAVLYRYADPKYYTIATKHFAYSVEQGLVYAQKIANVYQEYESQLQRTSRIEHRISSLSPAFMLERLAESFAGTSIDYYDRFLSHCRIYRSELINYLRGKNAFNSWRWFTDDPPSVNSWVTFVGYKPEEVTLQNLNQFMASFTPSMREQFMKQAVAADSDPARTLDIGDMPQFSYKPAGAGEILTTTAVHLGFIILLNAVLFAANFVAFLRYDVR